VFSRSRQVTTHEAGSRVRVLHEQRDNDQGGNDGPHADEHEERGLGFDHARVGPVPEATITAGPLDFWFRGEHLSVQRAQTSAKAMLMVTKQHPSTTMEEPRCSVSSRTTQELSVPSEQLEQYHGQTCSSSRRDHVVPTPATRH
jgi:hypothetical protein